MNLQLILSKIQSNQIYYQVRMQGNFQLAELNQTSVPNRVSFKNNVQIFLIFFFVSCRFFFTLTYKLIFPSFAVV